MLDAAGRIRYKQIGPITPDVWLDTIRPVLDAIAAEAPFVPKPADLDDSPLPNAMPDTAVLSDPELIAMRTEAVSKTLRCVVCQNQSIYDSNAPLAQDMRRLVRKRVIAGDTDDEARAYLRSSYGDYVLMTPPLQLNTILLWLAPLLLMLGGGWWFMKRRREGQPAANQTMSAEDAARVRAALAERDTAS